jgi:hypothetical protein
MNERETQPIPRDAGQDPGTQVDDEDFPAEGKASSSVDINEWMVRPFEEFVDHTLTVTAVLGVGATGAEVLLMEEVLGHDLVVEILSAKLPDVVARPEVETLIDGARAEVEAGFPILNGLLIVGCWAGLEALILDFLTNWLMNVPDAMQNKAVQNVRQDIGPSPDRERAYYVIKQIYVQPEHRKQGIDRFESVLAIFGLDGPVDKETRSALSEMQQVRHVLAHGRGIASLKFIQRCPRLGLKAGEPLRISAQQTSRYSKALANYGRTLLLRFIERYESRVGQGLAL